MDAAVRIERGGAGDGPALAALRRARARERGGRDGAGATLRPVFGSRL